MQSIVYQIFSIRAITNHNGRESWCYMYNWQTKWQSTARLSLGASRLAKVKEPTSLITFVDAKGLLHHLHDRRSFLQFIWQLWNVWCATFVEPSPNTVNWTVGVCCITMRWRTSQLFWRVIMLKIKSPSYTIPPSHRIYLWLTFFGFVKSYWRWEALFLRIFRPSKALVLRSWRQFH